MEDETLNKEREKDVILDSINASTLYRKIKALKIDLAEVDSRGRRRR